MSPSETSSSAETSLPLCEETEAHWLDDKEQAVWRSYLRSHAELQAHLHRRLHAQCDLSLPDYEVLVRLTETHSAGSARVFQLSRSLQWEKSRLSHHLKRMEARGLVTRHVCPTDARGAIVSITDEGRAAIERAAPCHVSDVRRLVFDVLTPEQLDIMAQISDRILLAISDNDRSAPPVEDCSAAMSAEIHGGPGSTSSVMDGHPDKERERGDFSRAM